MKEFDDIFNKRINEEQPFAGQKSSWTLLNKQLHLFEAGAGSVGKSLALWKAVGAVAILSVAGLLFNLRQITKENQKLRETIDSLLVAKPQEGMPPVNAPFRIAPAGDKQGQFDPAETAQSFQPHPQRGRLNKDAQTSQQQGLTTKTGIFSGAIANASLPHPVGTSIQFSKTISTFKTNSTFIPAAAATVLPPDILSKDSIGQLFKVESRSNEPMAIVADSQQLIIPALPSNRSRNRSARWRIGLRVLAGTPHPKEKGVSLLSGQGALVSYEIWNGLTASLTADFLKYEVNAGSIPKCFPEIQVPKPHPGHHDDELVNVLSNQVVQQYSLGLSYPVKLAGPLVGSISLGHCWAYSPGRIASFKFEDNHGPGPGPGPHQIETYVVAKTPKSLISNIWRAGLGLHYELPKWSFGIKGEIYKGSNKKGTSRDASVAVAELLYKF